MVEHEGFEFKVVGGTLLLYTQVITQSSLTMKNYTATDDFFVIDLHDIDIILGI